MDLICLNSARQVGCGEGRGPFRPSHSWGQAAREGALRGRTESLLWGQRGNQRLLRLERSSSLSLSLFRREGRLERARTCSRLCAKLVIELELDPDLLTSRGMIAPTATERATLSFE